MTICTGAGGRVDVEAAVDPAGVAGPVVESARVDVDDAEVGPAGFVVGCDCDLLTGGLRVDEVLRFGVCASDAGASVSRRGRISREIRGLFVATRFG